jgi:hypothetical protein
MIQYHRRDQPHIDPLLERISQVSDEVCAELVFCAASSRLVIDFATSAPAFRSPYMETVSGDRQSRRLVLSSPWLYGIPIGRTWDESYLDDLTHRLTYALAAGVAHSPSEFGMSQLQKAIAAEYAVWREQRDSTQAPLLGRIVERHGVDQLSRVFFTLRGARLSSLFLVRWLSLHPIRDEPAFFETLLNIEREAILVGRKDTFLLFQDDDWVEQQSAFFDRVRSHESPLSSPTIRVRSAQIIDDRALVILDSSTLILQDDLSHQALGQLVFFRRRDWDWKHASTDEAEFWDIPSLQIRGPGSLLTSTPLPVPDRDS